METLNNIFFFAAIIICAFALYRTYEISNKKKTLNYEISISDNMYNIIFGVAILVALFIRIYKFGSVPGGFNQDGAMAAVDAKALADYGTDRYGMRFPVHLTAWGYGQMSALLSYLMALFIKLFGLSPITARLPQLIMSVAGMVCLCLFVKDVFGKKAALVAAIFVAINPWHILQSRWALDCNLYPHFFIIGVYLLNKGLSKRVYIYLSMASFGLCMYCYGISIYTMPLFLAAACIYLLVSKRITVKDMLICAGVYLLIAWPFILTMAINFFKLDTIETPLFTIPYFANSVRSSDILFFSDNIGEQLIANIKSLVNTTLLQKKDLPWNDVENFGTMYLFTMPFAIIGLVFLIKNYNKSAGGMLTLIFLLTGIWCGLTTNGVNVNRINIIYYPIMIISILGIYGTIKLIRNIHWGIIAAYAVAFVIFSTTYFTSYADIMEVNFFKDFEDAVASVKDSDADKFYITADSQYTGASNVSEILTLFKLEIDAKYYQGETPEGELPYKEKYTFESIKNIEIDPSENAVYVVTERDLSYFDQSDYEVEQFGDYYTLTPRS